MASFTPLTFEKYGEQAQLLTKLSRYVPESDCDAETCERFRAFVRGSADCFQRSNAPGHVTGSAWIVSADFTAALLHYHRKLGIWVQLGGHADGCAELLSVALREAEEESGISGFQVVSEDILDLDIHLIPERGAEPAHYHYDVRFLLQAPPLAEPVCSTESQEIRWVALSELSQLTTEESIARMARKAESYRPLFGSIRYLRSPGV